MNQAWPFVGARWWKFDFHTNTPASKDTNAWQSSIGTPDELTLQKYLLKYMAAGIDGVAVTDHNSGEGVELRNSQVATMHSNVQPKPGHWPFSTSVPLRRMPEQALPRLT
nr:hypothetical protein [Pseudomonas sp. B3G-3]